MDEVVVLSSDDEESVFSENANDKRFKEIWKIAKVVMFSKTSIKNELTFPYSNLKKLFIVLKKKLSEIYSESLKAFIFSNILQWLQAMKLAYDDLVHDEKFNFILVDFMALYINYKCNLNYKTTSYATIEHATNEMLTSLHIIFNETSSFILMTLLKVEAHKQYASLLYRIYEKYLSDKRIYNSNDMIRYILLILCYRQWRMLVSDKKDKEDIYIIALGKTETVITPEGKSVTTMTQRGVLPRIAPTADATSRPFIEISDLINIAMRRGSDATRLLLTDTLMDFPQVIDKYFKQYEQYIDRHHDFELCFSSQRKGLNNHQSTLETGRHAMESDATKRKMAQHSSNICDTTDTTNKLCDNNLDEQRVNNIISRLKNSISVNNSFKSSRIVRHATLECSSNSLRSNGDDVANNNITLKKICRKIDHESKDIARYSSSDDDAPPVGKKRKLKTRSKQKLVPYDDKQSVDTSFCEKSASVNVKTSSCIQGEVSSTTYFDNQYQYSPTSKSSQSECETTEQVESNLSSDHLDKRSSGPLACTEVSSSNLFVKGNLKKKILNNNIHQYLDDQDLIQSKSDFIKINKSQPLPSSSSSCLNKDELKKINRELAIKRRNSFATNTQIRKCRAESYPEMNSQENNEIDRNHESYFASDQDSQKNENNDLKESRELHSKEVILLDSNKPRPNGQISSQRIKNKKEQCETKLAISQNVSKFESLQMQILPVHTKSEENSDSFAKYEDVEQQKQKNKVLINDNLINIKYKLHTTKLNQKAINEKMGVVTDLVDTNLTQTDRIQNLCDVTNSIAADDRNLTTSNTTTSIANEVQPHITIVGNSTSLNLSSTVPIELLYSKNSQSDSDSKKTPIKLRLKRKLKTSEPNAIQENISSNYAVMEDLSKDSSPVVEFISRVTTCKEKSNELINYTNKSVNNLENTLSTSEYVTTERVKNSNQDDDDTCILLKKLDNALEDDESSGSTKNKVHALDNSSLNTNTESFDEVHDYGKTQNKCVLEFYQNDFMISENSVSSSEYREKDCRKIKIVTNLPKVTNKTKAVNKKPLTSPASQENLYNLNLLASLVENTLSEAKKGKRKKSEGSVITELNRKDERTNAIRSQSKSLGVNIVKLKIGNVAKNTVNKSKPKFSWHHKAKDSARSVIDKLHISNLQDESYWHTNGTNTYNDFVKSDINEINEFKLCKIPSPTFSTSVVDNEDYQKRIRVQSETNQICPNIEYDPSQISFRAKNCVVGSELTDKLAYENEINKQSRLSKNIDNISEKFITLEESNLKNAITPETSKSFLEITNTSKSPQSIASINRKDKCFETNNKDKNDVIEKKCERKIDKSTLPLDKLKCASIKNVLHLPVFQTQFTVVNDINPLETKRALISLSTASIEESTSLNEEGNNLKDAKIILINKEKNNKLQLINFNNSDKISVLSTKSSLKSFESENGEVSFNTIVTHSETAQINASKKFKPDILPSNFNINLSCEHRQTKSELRKEYLILNHDIKTFKIEIDNYTRQHIDEIGQYKIISPETADIFENLKNPENPIQKDEVIIHNLDVNSTNRINFNKFILNESSITHTTDNNSNYYLKIKSISCNTPDMNGKQYQKGSADYQTCTDFDRHRSILEKPCIVKLTDCFKHKSRNEFDITSKKRGVHDTVKGITKVAEQGKISIFSKENWKNEKNVVCDAIQTLKVSKLEEPLELLLKALSSLPKKPSMEVYFILNKMMVTIIHESLSSEDCSKITSSRNYKYICTETKKLQAQNIDNARLFDIENKYHILKKNTEKLHSLSIIQDLEIFLAKFTTLKTNLFNENWLLKNTNNIQKHTNINMLPIEHVILKKLNEIQPVSTNNTNNFEDSNDLTTKDPKRNNLNTDRNIDYGMVERIIIGNFECTNKNKAHINSNDIKTSKNDYNLIETSEINTGETSNLNINSNLSSTNGFVRNFVDDESDISLKSDILLTDHDSDFNLPMNKLYEIGHSNLDSISHSVVEISSEPKPVGIDLGKNDDKLFHYKPDLTTNSDLNLFSKGCFGLDESLGTVGLVLPLTEHELTNLYDDIGNTVSGERRMDQNMVTVNPKDFFPSYIREKTQVKPSETSSIDDLLHFEMDSYIPSTITFSTFDFNEYNHTVHLRNSASDLHDMTKVDEFPKAINSTSKNIDENIELMEDDENLESVPFYVAKSITEIENDVTSRNKRKNEDGIQQPTLELQQNNKIICPGLNDNTLLLAKDIICCATDTSNRKLIKETEKPIHETQTVIGSSNQDIHSEESLNVSSKNHLTNCNSFQINDSEHEQGENVTTAIKCNNRIPPSGKLQTNNNYGNAIIIDTSYIKRRKPESDESVNSNKPTVNCKKLAGSELNKVIESLKNKPRIQTTKIILTNTSKLSSNEREKKKIKSIGRNLKKKTVRKEVAYKDCDRYNI